MKNFKLSVLMMMMVSLVVSSMAFAGTKTEVKKASADTAKEVVKDAAKTDSKDAKKEEPKKAKKAKKAKKVKKADEATK